eukprot:TRINITY_DN9692_c0_g1_i9.p1 TRINITY_DN9692_c0_g1~~TRINITY_DN9692_c0_g1_i9.p1  ORF type:complete len:246 (-),score=14.05 TRINITY_DN9692_c0_g1_i9:382-1119(-)
MDRCVFMGELRTKAFLQVLILRTDLITMGNKTSTNFSALRKPITEITPKVPLMKLNSIRKLKSIADICTPQNSDAAPANKAPSPRSPKKPQCDTKDQAAEKSSPQWPKVVFKMVETVQTDNPCDMEEEELLNLSLVKTGMRCLKRRGTFASKTPITVLNNSFNMKKRNAVRTQHKLMKALFETEMCYSCLRPVVDREGLLTNVCGHTFHINCIKGLVTCPNCDTAISINCESVDYITFAYLHAYN